MSVFQKSKELYIILGNDKELFFNLIEFMKIITCGFVIKSFFHG